jgi:hypothetical protein
VQNEYDPAMARWGSVVAVGALTLLAACSSSGDAEPTDTTAFIPSVASTTEPTTTTTIAPTTIAPTTIAPTTTPPPPTTIDPDVALAQEVEADLLEADRLENEASQEPFDTERERAALERRLGFAADSLRQKLQSYRERGVAIRPNPQVPASLTVEVPAQLVVEGGDVATVQVCEVNSWILVEVGAGPDGSDAIVNPDVVTSRSTVFLRNENGVWKVEGGNEIAAWEGLDRCPER